MNERERERGSISVGYVRRVLGDGRVERQIISSGKGLIFYGDGKTCRLTDLGRYEAVWHVVAARGGEAFVGIGRIEGKLVFVNMIGRVAYVFSDPGHIGYFPDVGNSSSYMVVGDLNPGSFKRRLMEHRSYFALFTDFLDLPEPADVRNN